ncbi:MAG: response regulator transcription factor [Flavobacteriales bacterium]|nr:response regulator transcription factor [Flavobacteriales bacterium]
MENESKRHRILLVEDEESLIDMIRFNLELEGYDVTTAEDGRVALELSEKARFDLCILDIMLPKVDGITVCKTLRLRNQRIPILFLSAKSTGNDRVEGLRAGGDDYLTKPFNLEELLLRVKNLLRLTRLPEPSQTKIRVYEFGGNRVDFENFQIFNLHGEEKNLSKKETSLLKFLIENEGNVVSREEILDTVWGYDVYPTTRTIDNYILSFRKHFEQDSKNPKYFHSVRGVGYKFINSLP